MRKRGKDNGIGKVKDMGKGRGRGGEGYGEGKGKGERGADGTTYTLRDTIISYISHCTDTLIRYISRSKTTRYI